MAEKQATNWIENDKIRAKFWTTCQDQFGLSHQGVHEILGVESMKDYAGTFEQAITALKVWEQNQQPEPVEPEQEARTQADVEATTATLLAGACQTLPEAPVCANTRFHTPNGYTYQLTMRAGLPSELARLALRQLTEQIRLFEDGASKMGWKPVMDGRDSIMTYPAGNGNGGQAKAPAPSTPASGGNPPPQTAAGDAGGGTFETDRLVATTTDGKTYWKVKGPRFSQYGVTVWPEVLAEAGFDVDALDPAHPPSLAGYTAHYVLNEKGKPNKVTKLVRN